MTSGCFNIGGQQGIAMVLDASGIGGEVLCDASGNIRGVVLNLHG